MKYLLSTSIILSIFLLFPFLKAEGQTGHHFNDEIKPGREKINQEIDSILNSRFNKGKLNGNVLVVKNGKEIYKKSCGFADAGKTQKLTEDYRFNIGSVYKEFPAVAIMQLEELGKLTLQDTFSRYVEDLPQWADSISIRNLLQYSSGLPKINWGARFSTGEMVTEEMIMNDLRNIAKLEFSPGTDYLYSNYSPVLLTKMVEIISGQDFKKNAVLQKHLTFNNLFEENKTENALRKELQDLNDSSFELVEKLFPMEKHNVITAYQYNNLKADEILNAELRINHINHFEKYSYQRLYTVKI